MDEKVCGAGWIDAGAVLQRLRIDSLAERQRLVRHGAARFESDDISVLLMPASRFDAWTAELVAEGVILPPAVGEDA